MRAVLYLRYSSYAQTEQSIEGQNRECTEYCRKNGYTIVGKYIDRAKSANKNIEKRTEFLRMMNDSARDMFDVVVVWALDRFARSTRDASYYRSILKSNNVRLVSTRETVPDDPSGIIIGNLFDAFAEYYSAELSIKVTRGMKESALKGQSLGSYAPVGYIVNKEKKYEVDETVADKLRKAWEMFADGAKKKEVIEYLETVGIRNSMGKRPWTYNSLRRMFENEMYVGTYNKNGVRLEGAIPAIIDNKLWLQVQERLNGGISPMQTANNYLFSTKLYCAHCGERMTAYSGTGGHNGIQYLYYRCKNHGKKKNDPLYCKAKPIKKTLLENAVIDDTIKLFLAVDLDVLTDYLYEDLEEFLSIESAPSLELNIRKAQTQITNLTEAIAIHGYTTAIGERLSEAERELEKLMRTKEEMEIIFPTREELRTYLHKKFNKGEFSHEEKVLIVQEIVDRIEYSCEENDEKHIKIVYNLWGQTAVKKDLRIQERITELSKTAENETALKARNKRANKAGSRFNDWCTSRDSNPGPTD